MSMHLTAASTIELCLCCNDHSNGIFQRWVEDVTIDLPCGETIELSGPRTRVRQCDGGKRWKIGRTSVFALASTTWYGNWCWDMIRVSQSDARAVANYLKLSRKWECHCAPSVIYDRWREPGEITPEEWQDLLGEKPCE